MVSIRTRHLCRVMRWDAAWMDLRQGVSIRTRHLCRVMRANLHGANLYGAFQSAPGISAG